MLQKYIGASRFLFGCAAFVSSILMLTLAVPSLSKRDPWFIDPAGKTGRITAQSNYSDLVRIFGARNIEDGEVELGEGQTLPATVVFPKDSSRRIAIAWKDSTNKRNPDRVQIVGEKSRWRTSFGLTLGMTLRDLERINGRPLVLTNYETDYEGTVRSWKGGFFDSEMENQGHVAVRLLRPAKLIVTVEEFEKMTEEELEIPSSNPILRKMNPSVSEITWSYK
jgi:hypothetical protein